MFSREVLDILVATLATFILYMITLSPTESTSTNFMQLMLVIIILLNFLHLVFYQLNRVEDIQSKIVGIVNLILSLFLLPLFFITQLQPFEGFWNRIEDGFDVFGLIFLSLMLLCILLGLNAEFLYIRRSKE